ncbi:unnamed protein product [Hydatigera taeniaeformis]|uniref:non-specific serine/threonine protein kinase n=1 Tax=Hydatigena taeniaeformis TaxID=6205 RepID=A0A158RE56_HYDTA|nr:unnamed protein product [Hydatigera taeniaeformis]
MEYEIAKKMGNFKLASSILAESYTSRNSRWADEVSNIFAGLQSAPVSQQCQKLFFALPHRIQTDMTISYLNTVFTTVESKADFILQFLTNKLEMLVEGGVVGVLLENLIDLLMAAEQKHCQAFSSRIQNCKVISSPPQSPAKEVTSLPSTQPCPTNEFSGDFETDEGEEGEVLEEADDDDEEEMDDEDVDNQGSRLLVEKQCISALNFHRMRLACEVFPMVHRTRNGIKISSSQLHTLVVKSFQFLLTFAAQVPFAANSCPEIFGLSGPLPELLRMEPAKYLRLFLDMASDLLKWPVTGPSFQIQHHSDIFDMLRTCYHIYKDLEHEVQRQKGGSGSGGGGGGSGGAGVNNSKKRTSATAHSLFTVANQFVCIFWSLFVEKGIACLREFSLRTCVPFCTTTAALSIDGCDLPMDEQLSESLHFLQSLWSLRLRFKAQEKKSRSKSSRKVKSVLEDAFSSLQPQGGASDPKFSCLLELLVRVNLILAGLNDVNADFEEVFENSALLIGAYSEDQFRALQCLLSATKLCLKPPTQAKQLAADRLRLVHRVLELKLNDTEESRSWTKLSNQTIVISIATSRHAAEACMACVERWLVGAITARSSVDAACLAFVLHQNPFWARLSDFTCPADLKLPLDEILVFLLDLINDATLVHLQPLAVDSLSSLLWYLPIETQALEIRNLFRLQDWCFDQMKSAPSGNVALLLCHAQNVCFYSRRYLQCNFISFLESVLMCFECGWSDLSGLGWFLRLLRWAVAEVCTTPDLHRSVVTCFVKRAPILFKFWPKFRDTACRYLTPNLHLPTLDIKDRSSSILAQAVGGCLNDSFALDGFYVTSPILENQFNNWKDLVKSSLVYLPPDASFMVEEQPFLLPSRINRRPQPNCVDTGCELLAFCRWIVNTSVFLKDSIPIEEIRPFFCLLVNFYSTEWSRHADRMRFQAEDSIFSQFSGMSDFFATFGALLVALEAFKLTELLDAFKVRLPDYQQSWIYECLSKLLLADEEMGWLWWPVFDWVLRFQWQRAVETKSLQSLKCFIALDVISKVLGSARSFLAIEVGISTAVTGLVISSYCVQHKLQSIDGFSSSIDRIWNQALLWFEQLSASNHEDSRYRNEMRRALLHDRLITCLLESLLRLDAFIIADHIYAPSRTQHLALLWSVLLSPTVFGNPFVPWRYRLGLFVYLVWPKISMEIVCSTETVLPPPLVFLLSTHSSASDILRYYFLHWSLGYLLHPEDPLPEAFPRVNTVPVFGEKHMQLIEKFVPSHLPEPPDLWTRLFFHLVSPGTVETSCLQEVVDYTLLDVEQRFGLANVLFALLQKVPERNWPHHLCQLIRSLFGHKSANQLPANVAAHCIDIDLDDDNVSSSISDSNIARPHSFESKVHLPLNVFSHSSLLSITMKCLQEIIPKLSWRSAYDTRWLAELHRFLRNVQFSHSDNETVVELFCILIDTLRDALKAQLILKRWSLFLTTVTAVNDFGDVLCTYFTAAGDEISQNEIWEKIARQVIKLAEAAWAGGGVRWPEFGEGFLPPNLASVFCQSCGVWIRLHSLGLLGNEVPVIPLDAFLTQGDTSTAFQPLKFLQSKSIITFQQFFPSTFLPLQKTFKSLCCIEGFVAITSHLLRLILLFVSDISADLDHNASRIGFYLVTRLTLLFMGLFVDHHANTDEPTFSLLSSPPSAVDDVEQTASQLLSRVVSLKPDFILNLSEALLEVGCHFLEDPCESSADSMWDPLGGYYPRISVWLALARFIRLLISSSPNATPTSNSYLNWRLISGIVDFIDAEYESNRLQNIGFLLSALLANIKVVVETTSVIYGDQLIEILDHLLQVSGGTRFSNSICHLDNIFEDNALLEPYQSHFSRHCKCDRRDVNEELQRFLKSTDFMHHPRLLKYRATGLRQLTVLLRPRHEFTAAQLHERLVTVPHDRIEEKLRLMEAYSVRSWVPPTETNGYSDVVNQKRLLRMLIDLSASKYKVEIDSETRHAMAECAVSLKDIYTDEKSDVYPSNRVKEFILIDFPDPMIVEQLECVISIANWIASPNSIISRLGPQCLRCIFNNSRLRMALFDSLNIWEAEHTAGILTKLAPYVSVDELNKARNSVSRSALKFATKNVTEAVLQDLEPQTLVDLVLSYQDIPETIVVKIAEWLFDRALVLDECFLALKPLILSEITMAKRLIPWMFVAILVNLRLLSTSCTGKHLKQTLSGLTKVLNSLLEASQLPQFLLSILTALHTYSQWLIRSGYLFISPTHWLCLFSPNILHVHSVFSITTTLEWDFDWLSASKLSLNAGSKENAWLFFELAWIKRPQELLFNSMAQNLWIDLYQAQKDLVGLKAARIAMAQFFDHSDDGAALEDRFRCAINELNGQRSLLQEEEAGLSGQISSVDIEQIALRFHHLGADKAFAHLAAGLLSQGDENLPALTEAKYRVAWRSSSWKIGGSMMPTFRYNDLLGIDFKTLPTPRVHSPAHSTPTLQLEPTKTGLDFHFDVGSNLENIRRLCASCMSCWKESETVPLPNLEDEKFVYLLHQSIYCEDWNHVGKLVNDRRCDLFAQPLESVPAYFLHIMTFRSSLLQLLSENLTTFQSFASEVNILQAWSHISTLLQSKPKASSARAASSLILLQAFIEECIGWDETQPTSLLEASLRLSKSLSDSVGDASPWLSLLNVHAQLQLADLYIKQENALCAERMLRTIPRIEAAPKELTLRKNISFALVRSRLQRLCGETSLSCARLTSVLNDATESISGMKLTRDTSACLLLESYLSSTVSLCKWLAECGAMSLADIVVQRLKPAVELVEKSWSSEVKQLICSSADALAVLAEFADAQYQVFDSYLRSTEFSARRRLLSDAYADVDCLTEVDKKRFAPIITTIDGLLGFIFKAQFEESIIGVIDSNRNDHQDTGFVICESDIGTALTLYFSESCANFSCLIICMASKFLRLLQRQSNLESVELANLLSSLQNFFSTAILAYCQCLARSDNFNLKIYRLVSLLLNALSQVEKNLERPSCYLSEDSVTESLFTPAWLASLEAYLRAIRVDKFLPLFPQLLVRLTTPNGENGQSKTHAAFHAMLVEVNGIILSVFLRQAPCQILAIFYIAKFMISFVLKVDKSSARIALARQLFSEVCSLDITRKKLFVQMQALATAYIELANVDVEDKRSVKEDIPMPPSCALLRLSSEAERCLHLLPVITCLPRVDFSGNYQDLVRVVAFVNTYRLAGGLNLPKIVTCFYSSEPYFSYILQLQLLQLSQVIFHFYILYKCHAHTDLYGASFAVLIAATLCFLAANTRPWCTYCTFFFFSQHVQVVPLAHRSGLIEWCEGTIPLGEWLAGETFGAHQRYHPSDLTPSQAKLKLAGTRDKSLEHRLVVFTEICSKMQPVLGYFFLEYFPEPSMWYTAKRRYTASLATASILGYLVGLGDRHPHNLLLHPTTGEVVHIDLGIAFDQGRLMPTPEVVPFRLTRDLVHALGPLGVEVGFVGTAELALCAFSSGSEIILTLLEVLLHDPLYSWSLSPAQLCALEARRAEIAGCTTFRGNGHRERPTIANTNTTVPAATASGSIVNPCGTLTGRHRDSVNQLAERVLLTVRDKLAGRVGGIGSSGLTAGTQAEGALGTLRPAGHVALLVRTATDPQNLGRMYFGWQAYL